MLSIISLNNKEAVSRMLCRFSASAFRLAPRDADTNYVSLLSDFASS